MTGFGFKPLLAIRTEPLCRVQRRESVLAPVALTAPLLLDLGSSQAHRIVLAARWTAPISVVLVGAAARFWRCALRKRQAGGFGG
jgi:hypothetical protein